MLVYRIEHRTLFVGPWKWSGAAAFTPDLPWEVREALADGISAFHGRMGRSTDFFAPAKWGHDPNHPPKWRFGFRYFDSVPEAVFNDADVARALRDAGFVLREYFCPATRPTLDPKQVIFNSGLAKMAYTFEL